MTASIALPRKVDSIIGTLENAGLYAYRAAELEYSYYHSHGMTVPSVGAIDDVVELSCGSAKPRHALWLSKGEVTKDNLVTTDWLEYVNRDEVYLPHCTDGLLHCVLDDNAVILELTCNEDVGKFYDLGALEWNMRFTGGKYDKVDEYQDEDGNWCEDWYEVEIERDDVVSSPLYYCDINYGRLRELGVDAVRVRGEKFADDDTSLFYGWDIDSIAILRGDCVIGLNPVAQV